MSTQLKRTASGGHADGVDDRFATLAELAPVGIFETDADGNCLFVNRRWCELSGLSPAEAAGRGWVSALHPDDRERVFDRWYGAAREGLEFREEYRFRTPGGRVHWLQGSAVALRAGGRTTGYLGTVTDVTDRKLAEDACRASEERFRFTARAAGVTLFRQDSDLRYTWVANPVTGYSAEGIVGLLEEEVNHLVEDLPALIRAKKEVLRTGRGARVEVRTAAPGSGREVHELILEPMRDSCGAVVGLMGASTNVTGRREIEAALRDRESLLRLLGDNLPAGAVYQVVATPDGGRRFNYMSAGIEGITGVTSAEALADAGAIYSLILPEDLPGLGAGEEESLRRHSPFVHEFRFRTRRDGIKWLHCRSAPRELPDGSFAWDGIVVDVTARKRAEDEVARLNAELAGRLSELQAILSSIQDYVYIFTPDGRFAYANKLLLELWGRTAEEVCGKTMADLDYPDEVRDVILQNIREVCETGGVVRSETSYTSPTGAGGHYENILAPVLGPSGEVVQVAGTSRDITERRRAEEALRDADRRKDEFLAVLAHELRNPLAPLRSGLQVMRLAGHDAPAAHKSRDMMERQLAHMVRLIDDLLDVSRISRNKLELRRSRVLLADVVSTAVETARPSIEAARHELTVALPAEPVYIDADLTRLAQVLSNLLTNSARYTDRGGQIRVSAGRVGAEIVVSVTDNGIGIPGVSLPRIFEMFSQVDRSLERTAGGLGIGLALVKGLVEMHGGVVTGESDGEGKGSTFTVRLPLPEDESRVEAPLLAETPRVATGARRRILVVDDNRDAAGSMATMLELSGHEVRTAHDGLDALAVAEEFRPGVILMDMGMPRLNGYDTTRRIRGESWGKRPVIVALTGWGQDGDRARAKDAGCDGHLVKPADPSDLEKLLSELEAGREGHTP